MADIKIGYMTWDTKRGQPHVGVRRCKVWSTVGQCEGCPSRFDSGELVVVEVFAKVVTPDG